MSTNSVRLRPIPTLLQFGRDLTRESREGLFYPVVGREVETRLLLETLCRRTKRNPLLVGPPGVGKTAVVEGFAIMVAQGTVPDFMKDSVVILLQPSLILAASRGQQGNLEKWMSAIIAEASQEGIILFIDEVHTIVGAGGTSGTTDIASMMKPTLARGDIACIAATTDDEYRRFIESDSALERRFQPIRVQELNLPQTLQVLRVVRDELSVSRGVLVDDTVLERLLDHANSSMRNRTFPDKGIDLLEQCVASALANGSTSVALSDADEVFSRLTGIPLNINMRLDSLESTLRKKGIMDNDDVHTLLNRLQVTMNGLDIRPIRPNSVILLVDAAAQHALPIAEAISLTLYDTPERIVAFDMGRISTAEECTLFFGAPPGYVGYGDTAPIHAIKQTPACILVLENMYSCSNHVLQLIEQGIKDGFLLDGQARKIFLSDTIVILTAGSITGKPPNPVGFRSSTHDTPLDTCRQVAAEALGSNLLNLVDLVCASLPTGSAKKDLWIRSSLLEELSVSYKNLNLEVKWDESVVRWLSDEYNRQPSEDLLERIVDEQITPVVMRYSDREAEVLRKVSVYFMGQVLVEEYRI